VAANAGSLLKAVNGLVNSLKAGEIDDNSPLFNAARYLGFAARTKGMRVLDFDLRIEGMTIVKDAYSPSSAHGCSARHPVVPVA
jgi:hypothetical protein